MSYTKQNWKTGDIISAEKLNHIEGGIEEAFGAGGVDDYPDLKNKPSINNVELVGNKTLSQLGAQEKLTSGTNIKTINNESLLGSGNIKIEGGGLSEVTHNTTITGAGTAASPLSVNTNNVALKTDIPDTSEFITKSVNNLTNYTKTSDLGDLALQDTVDYETKVTNKPTIPSAVTESTVSGWGFTKNTGTYSKPDGGIPKTDLTNAVQTSLEKADSAIQSHQDISGKEDKTNKVTSITSTSTDTQYPSAKAVYTLVNNTAIDDIPSYVIEESESVLAKAFSHKNLGRTIRFIAVSDAHNDEGNLSHDYTQISNKHCGQAVKYISDRIALDFVSFLGDGTWAGVATVDNYATQLKDDIQQMNSFLSEGFRGIPNIRLVGNHDQILLTDGYRIQNDGAYNLFGRYNAGHRVENTNYGYYDIEDSKVRIIYLNTSDTVDKTSAGTLLSMLQDQKNWLCETLIDVNTKTDANEWKIILLSHAPLDMANFEIDSNILIAYTNGETYGNYTFTNHSAKIICNFHGHIHCYSYGYIQDKIRRATIPNSNFYDNNHYKNNTSYAQWTDETTYAKTQNSRTDTSFSLVTIDLDNEICYIDNYGAGIDRTFSVSYKKAVSSISNASYSGITTVGTTIDTSAISYTLTYSDGSTAILSGGVTVNPSTIETVGNNTVTVNYTESGATVTTTMTIVGTAVPVANLIDLNRTYETIPTDASIGDYLDDTKGYTNVAYGTGKGYAKSCTTADVSSNSITVTEAGVGGIAVAIPIKITNINKSYTLSFDYSGTGKARTYYRYAKSASGDIQASNTAFINDTTGASGSASVEIPDAYNKYGAGADWLIISFTSNTSGTKTFENIALVEK